MDKTNTNAEPKMDNSIELSYKQYLVQKLLDKKTLPNGRVEKYYMKWKNTWKTVENLDCPDCPDHIAKLEEQRKQENKSKEEKDKSSVAENEKIKRKSEEEPHGFDRGLEAEKIIGASDVFGKRIYLIKWKDFEKHDMVLAKTANLNCPQLVIKFYEEREIGTLRKK